jgi:hypothetical protein
MLLKEVAVEKGTKQMATRKLNNLGEIKINAKCNLLNHPDRLKMLQSVLELGETIEGMSAL